ncbi:MAG: hypothetical protein OER74_11295 [Desulfobacteraceae bacterium]|nr:hypothetical protein [Desulfobacteraceae bacterium]
MGSKDAFSAETDLAVFLTGLSALLKLDELVKSLCTRYLNLLLK